MNKRIEDLALGCGAWHQVYDHKSLMVDRHFDIEKFGRLIVRECALIAGLMEHEGRKNIGAQILDNFGISMNSLENAELIHSDKGYSLGTPEAQEAFDSKRGYKL